MRRWLKRMKRKSTGGWAMATTLELALEAVAAASALAASLLLVYFPHSRDTPPSPEETDKTPSLYATVYDKPERGRRTVSRKSTRRGGAGKSIISALKKRSKHLCNGFTCETAKALDVGSGSGYLHDVVEDYTGLDISPSARRFYHKRRDSV